MAEKEDENNKNKTVKQQEQIVSDLGVTTQFDQPVDFSDAAASASHNFQDTLGGRISPHFRSNQGEAEEEPLMSSTYADATKDEPLIEMFKADINEEQLINGNNRVASSATILSDYQSNPGGEAVNSRSDLNKLSQATMVEAQQIEFFGGKGGGGEGLFESSPESPLLVNGANELLMAASQHLDVFALDDDAKSFDEEPVDLEEEERAVAEFVSEIELQHKSGMQLRATDVASEDENDNENNDNIDGDEDKEAKGKDDDEVSQQFSIDDVTDDEEGDPPPPTAL